MEDWISGLLHHRCRNVLQKGQLLQKTHNINTILIEHEIFDPEKRITKVTMSKLQPVYCVSSMQMCFLSTGQILQSRLRVE